jgi:hypothetical protein
MVVIEPENDFISTKKDAIEIKKDVSSTVDKILDQKAVSAPVEKVIDTSV